MLRAQRGACKNNRATSPDATNPPSVCLQASERRRSCLSTKATDRTMFRTYRPKHSLHLYSPKTDPLAAFGKKAYLPRGGFLYSARSKAAGPGRGPGLIWLAPREILPRTQAMPSCRHEGNLSRAQRNPMLLFWFVGLLLFRFATRRLFGLLFQLPPRKTRYVIGRPPQSRIQTKAGVALGVCSCLHRKRETATRSPRPRSPKAKLRLSISALKGRVAYSPG